MLYRVHKLHICFYFFLFSARQNDKLIMFRVFIDYNDYFLTHSIREPFQPLYSSFICLISYTKYSILLFLVAFNLNNFSKNLKRVITYADVFII